MNEPDAKAREALAAAYDRALDLEKSGRVEEAAAAWRAVLALDASDPGGAAMRLAALGAAEAPERASAAYVATLFDQHADVFDLILVDQLEYGVPMLARERLQAAGLGPFRAMLDLGCGTGLAAEALEDMTGRRVGVDLASGMIEIADEKELYDRLFVGDAVRFLAETADRFDLIVATDVLPYLGDPAPFFAGAARAAEPGAILIVSTETLDERAFGDRAWTVTPHQRFAHRLDRLEDALGAAGFDPIEATEIMVRREEGAPIPGHLVLARRRPA